eukprot:m.341975 g.341975  ORF g.341975 m.341975 type:complete len:486 (+) comp20737_c0_seq1:229-1686(+)
MASASATWLNTAWFYEEKDVCHKGMELARRFKKNASFPRKFRFIYFTCCYFIFISGSFSLYLGYLRIFEINTMLLLFKLFWNVMFFTLFGCPILFWFLGRRDSRQCWRCRALSRENSLFDIASPLMHLLADTVVIYHWRTNEFLFSRLLGGSETVKFVDGVSLSAAIIAIALRAWNYVKWHHEKDEILLLEFLEIEVDNKYISRDTCERGDVRNGWIPARYFGPRTLLLLSPTMLCALMLRCWSKHVCEKYVVEWNFLSFKKFKDESFVIATVNVSMYARVLPYLKSAMQHFSSIFLSPIRKPEADTEPKTWLIDFKIGLMFAFVPALFCMTWWHVQWWMFKVINVSFLEFTGYFQFSKSWFGTFLFRGLPDETVDGSVALAALGVQLILIVNGFCRAFNSFFDSQNLSFLWNVMVLVMVSGVFGLALFALMGLLAGISHYCNLTGESSYDGFAATESETAESETHITVTVRTPVSGTRKLHSYV